MIKEFYVFIKVVYADKIPKKGIIFSATQGGHLHIHINLLKVLNFFINSEENWLINKNLKVLAPLLNLQLEKILYHYLYLSDTLHLRSSLE